MRPGPAGPLLAPPGTENSPRIKKTLGFPCILVKFWLPRAAAQFSFVPLIVFCIVHFLYWYKNEANRFLLSKSPGPPRHDEQRLEGRAVPRLEGPLRWAVDVWSASVGIDGPLPLPG